jgi:hypothetical protein
MHTSCSGVPELPLSSGQNSKTRHCGRHSRQTSTLSQLFQSRGFLAQDHPTGERRNVGPRHSRQVIEIRSTSSNRARIQRTWIQLEQQTLIVDHLAVLRSCFRPMVAHTGACLTSSNSIKVVVFNLKQAKYKDEEMEVERLVSRGYRRHVFISHEATRLQSRRSVRKMGWGCVNIERRGEATI